MAVVTPHAAPWLPRLLQVWFTCVGAELGLMYTSTQEEFAVAAVPMFWIVTVTALLLASNWVTTKSGDFIVAMSVLVLLPVFGSAPLLPLSPIFAVLVMV